MVRLSKRALRPATQRHMAGHRLDGRHFQRLLLVERWQQAGQAAGQQGFAGARRPGKKQIVAACGGDQQRPLGRQLALHITQIGIRLAHVQQAAGHIGFNHHAAGKMRHGLQQMLDRDHCQPRGQTCLFGARQRHHQNPARRPRRQCGRQYALLV